jgi:hypothetical protein
MYARTLAATLLFSLSFAAQANSVVNGAESSVRTWKHRSAEIWNGPRGYVLRIKSHGTVDSDKSVNREITVPVSVHFEANGIARSYQTGGSGDLDIATGAFKDFSGHRLGDLFTTYQGTIRSVGIVVAGGGLTRASSSHGIKFAQSNGALIVGFGPEASLGSNGGLTWQDFDLTITPKGNVATIATSLFSNCAGRVGQQCLVTNAKRSVATAEAKSIHLD